MKAGGNSHQVTASCVLGASLVEEEAEANRVQYCFYSALAHFFEIWYPQKMDFIPAPTA